MPKPLKHSAQCSILSAPFAAVAEPKSLLSSPPEESFPTSAAIDSPDEQSVSRPATPRDLSRVRAHSNALEKALGKRIAAPSSTSPDESEVLFDAWHASFSDQFTLSLARRHLDGKSDFLQLFAIKDDRQSLSDLTEPPWHAICSLIITGAGGTRWAGTGWLAGPRTVITAGHCLYRHTRGGVARWAEQVEIIFPNLGQAEAPIRASEYRSVMGWIEGGNAESDYGAVLLPAEAIPEEITPLTYAVLDDAELGREDALVAGFCTDRQPRTLWGFPRTIREAQPRQLLFDRPVFGGLSGGPVLMHVNDTWTVVGMQQDGDFAGTVAVRITSAVSRTFDSWIERNPEK
jgi:V8-like Glu-specific endopeptidase